MMLSESAEAKLKAWAIPGTSYSIGVRHGHLVSAIPSPKCHAMAPIGDCFCRGAAVAEDFTTVGEMDGLDVAR